MSSDRYNPFLNKRKMSPPSLILASTSSLRLSRFIWAFRKVCVDTLHLWLSFLILVFNLSDDNQTTEYDYLLLIIRCSCFTFFYLFYFIPKYIIAVDTHDHVVYFFIFFDEQSLTYHHNLIHLLTKIHCYFIK